MEKRGKKIPEPLSKKNTALITCVLLSLTSLPILAHVYIFNKALFIFYSHHNLSHFIIFLLVQEVKKFRSLPELQTINPLSQETRQISIFSFTCQLEPVQPSVCNRKLSSSSTSRTSFCLSQTEVHMERNASSTGTQKEVIVMRTN